MLKTPYITFKTVFLDEVTSTNDYASTLLSKSSPNEGTVISTYNQSKGRGQIGRNWYSGVDNNLTLSIILYPRFLSIPESFYLSMVLSLALAELVSNLIEGQTVKIKWPNDIFVDNKKIAGLLIQQNLQGNNINSTIFGIGLNVNQLSFPSELPNPISLRIITATNYNLKLIETMLLTIFSKWYGILKEGNKYKIKQEYLNLLYKRGELSLFVTSDQKTIKGEIIGVSEEGKILIATDNQLFSYNLHDIRLKLSS